MENNRPEAGFNTSTEQTFETLQPVPKKPARVFGQQTGEQKPDMVVSVLSLSTTARSHVLPYHKHVLFDNIGVNLIQFSLDGSTYVDFLEVGKAYVMDEHFWNRLFYLKTSAGLGIIRIISW